VLGEPSALVKALLAFTGFHDPFSDTSIAGEKKPGPVLTVVSERRFDRVFLFSTPALAEITERTKAELLKQNPGLAVEIRDVPLADPTNYLGLLKQLRSHFKTICGEHGEAEYSICVSSGTPHMHASWLMLAASGEIPARILQTRPRKYTREGQDRVSEIDFRNPQFPQIKPFGRLPDEIEDPDLGSIRIQLGVVGDEPEFVKALEKTAVLAGYDTHVLLLGETGVGKEVFANALHRLSHRAQAPFIAVNCAGLSETLIESQLFGHRKGAFTGANNDHKGYFQAASGGTLFLDEIGEMPTSSQAKLLRALDQGKILTLGENQEIDVNVRVIAATNQNVRECIKAKTFREDLFHRFDDRISIPPLRRRRLDIPKLAEHFLDRWNNQHGKECRLANDALLRLVKAPWPGNARQLRKVVEGSARLCRGKLIKEQDLIFDEDVTDSAPDSLPEPEEGFNLSQFLADSRQKLIDRAMGKCQGNRTKAAKLLGMTPQAVSQYLLKRE
jgi:transcriptional regulator with AAA-type ATPase domain